MRNFQAIAEVADSSFDLSVALVLQPRGLQFTRLAVYRARMDEYLAVFGGR